jgi:hypothetical protein
MHINDTLTYRQGHVTSVAVERGRQTVQTNNHLMAWLMRSEQVGNLGLR